MGAGIAIGGHLHVIAVKTEGNWQSEQGYSWLSPEELTDARVHWSRGTAYSGVAHVVAAESIGTRLPVPGYRWKTRLPDEDDADLNRGVIWGPGQAYDSYPHVLTANI